jgi:hypothetical protein
MQLTKLVDILEAEIPGLTTRASTRENLARLYAERGHRDEADAVLRSTSRTETRHPRHPEGTR